MSSGIREMIAPGAGSVEATRALGTSKRRAGIYPYQWLFPGPNSKHVRASNSVIMPAEYGSDAGIIDYTVPEGMRLSLRGIVFASTSPDWEAGSGDLVFSLSVTGISSRPVDWLAEVVTPLGTFEQPFPILGRLEFNSLNNLVVSVRPVANVTLSTQEAPRAGGFQSAMLVGHLYPNDEAGEG